MKFSRNLLLVLVMVSVFSLSAVAQEPVHWDVVQKIRDEGFNNSQVMDHVSWMTDVFGPRLANSPSYLEAVIVMELLLAIVSLNIRVIGLQRKPGIILSAKDSLNINCSVISRSWT